MKLPSANWFQRRLAFLFLLALLLKYVAPEATWLQIAMFFALGFAIWQLRSAVYRASLERLVRTPFFYAFDVLCVALYFVSYRVIFFFPLRILNALLFGTVIALVSAYRYERSLRIQRAIVARILAEAEARHAAEAIDTEK